MNFHVIRKNHRGVKKNGVGMSWPGFRRHPVRDALLTKPSRHRRMQLSRKTRNRSNRDRAGCA